MITSNNIRLQSKALHGTISPFITNLTYLSELNLSHKSLSGPLLDSLFSSLPLLKIIDLSDNELNGILSPFDMLSKSIVHVNLSSNQFSGAINSSNFKSAGFLSMLDISNNAFFGSLPHVNCSISSTIMYLDFSNNNFTGKIPGLGLCSSLRTFRAGFNSLAVSLHNDLYNASCLQEVVLPANKLSGQIGEGIVGLINLRVGALYGNAFTATIPYNIGKLYYLEKLLLHKNNLNGSLPQSLMNCSKLEENLGIDFLQGELSILDFSKLLHLKTIDLGTNFFSGILPSSLYSCKSLSAIRLGTIKNLAGCKNLRKLILSWNYYNESFLGDDEKLIGPDGFQNLQILGLGGCEFIGHIPGWLSGLSKLKVLDLSQNQLIGSIPETISILTNLEKLDLSGNNLSGEIPKSFKSLNFFSSFSVANNNLEGTIPTGGQFHAFPSTSYLGNPKLCGLILQQPCPNEIPHKHASNQRDQKEETEIFWLSYKVGFGISFVLTVFSFSRFLKFTLKNVFNGRKIGIVHAPFEAIFTITLDQVSNKS
ncbi:receptor-like protein 2 [Lycium barbarum]|uniref:receptor-like protein 2 n=1 Tax=Lycium barbarum TaxID=112863 RepID=UPI00293E4CD1|nr:receptor-like protein 2 [Lycium barbarum]